MTEPELNLGKLKDVIIFPFYECNWNCRHCTVSKPIGKIGFLASPPDAFEHHIDAEHLRRIGDWNVENITILGGEPFLSITLPDMLDMLKRKEVKRLEKGKEIIQKIDTNANIIVYTNSTLLFDQSIKDLKPIFEHIDFLTISIEGDEFWTKKIRGNIFWKCIDVLEKVREITNPIVRSSYWFEIVCKYCHGDVVPMGKNTFWCNRCNRYLREDEIKNQLVDLLKVIDILNAEGIPVIVYPRMGVPPLPRKLAKWFYAALSSMDMVDCLLPSYKNFVGIKSTCPAGWNRLAIDPRGYITPCQWNSNYIAHVLWDDDLIEKSAKGWLRRQKIMGCCYGCPLLSICRSSCKIVHDYLECPVKNFSLEKGDHQVVIGSEVRKINKFRAVNSLKKMSKVSPGVC